MSAPVNVLAVLTEAAGDLRNEGYIQVPLELDGACAAVAELIAAANELDEELDGPAIAYRLRAALAACGVAK